MAAHVTALIQRKFQTDRLPPAGWVPLPPTLDVKQVNGNPLASLLSPRVNTQRFSCLLGVECSTAFPIQNNKGRHFGPLLRLPTASSRSSGWNGSVKMFYCHCCDEPWREIHGWKSLDPASDLCTVSTTCETKSEPFHEWADVTDQKWRLDDL